MKDDGGVNTGASLTLTDAWSGLSYTGMRRKNGSEVYPEEVSRSGIYLTDNTTRRLTVSGLNPAKRYNFLFYSSHNTSDNTLTNFTIGAQTVSLNGSYNSNKTVQINGITPAANGQVVINVAKDASASVGLLTSMAIQSYTPGTVPVLGPSDLRVVDYNLTNTIGLQWQDRSDNETGYEVWRASDGGSYSLVATLGANATSYLNTGLAANKNYDYVVRAKNGSTSSSYSNPARGVTYASTVFININTSSVASSPWNNLNWAYQLGAVWSNFKDEAGTPTNMGMSQPVKIDGMVGPGVNTGNNSGVFPDKVLAEDFGMFPGLGTYIVLTGLNLSKTYDLTLFASVTGVFGENTTAYTINGKTYMLNSNGNKSGTLTIFGVTPDENGEVKIAFTTVDNATFALLGAIVAKGYDALTTPVTQAPVSMSSTMVVENSALASPDAQAALSDLKVIAAYPNPFDHDFTLAVPSTGNDNVQISLRDINGRIIYQKRVDNIIAGTNVVRMETGNSVVPPWRLFCGCILYKERRAEDT